MPRPRSSLSRRLCPRGASRRCPAPASCASLSGVYARGSRRPQPRRKENEFKIRPSHDPKPINSHTTATPQHAVTQLGFGIRASFGDGDGKQSKTNFRNADPVLTRKSRDVKMLFKMLIDGTALKIDRLQKTSDDPKIPTIWADRLFPIRQVDA